MGKIEERILHLRAEIDQLRIIADQSKIEHQTGLRHFDIMENLDLKTKSNIKIFFDSIKEIGSYFREHLRDKIEVIKKASPQTAEKLNKHLNSYEKKARELLKEYENTKDYRELDRKFNSQEFQNRSNELVLLANNLRDTIECSYECVIDAIFFED